MLPKPTFWKSLFLSSLSSLMTICSAQKSITIDEKAAKEAFEYLNKVRMNPPAYSQEIGIDLSKVKKQKALVWNDTLAKVAKEKAEDMAKRGYFSHTTPEGIGINYMIHRAGYKLEADWLKRKDSNFFESLAAGAEDGKGAIVMLIYDGGLSHNEAGHRIHLLGMDEWNEKFSDCGIGFVRNPESNYGTYICVIIARHSW
ncbi:MAG: CAP domain-containing protein [Bacteroidia bacterium]|nr:CAP domain-containing protein [Bacteroidia bacterium]